MKPTAADAILKAIEAQPGRTPDQLAIATGYPVNYTQRKCRELRDAGLIHIGHRSIKTGAQANHWMPGEGEDAPPLPNHQERRGIERRTGQKIATSADMHLPGHDPVIDPLTARFLGVRATA
jgi:hypothetical protein